MRTIVHISDLHFGRINEAILEPVLSAIRAAKPDVVAVSGDLTQRARTAEFAAARAFLDAIPFPQIVVPGNHDVPLFNVFARFIRRLNRYCRFITDDLAPFYLDDEIAVAGVNTARAFTFKGGRINRTQMADLDSRFRPLSGSHTKIVVTHHPFDLPDGMEGGRIVGRAKDAMAALAVCGVDLLLAGHFHIGHTGSSTSRFRIPGYSALLVAAGTTTSTRGRGRQNSFNVIRIDGVRITIERWFWSPEMREFEMLSCEYFERAAEGWARV